MRGYADVAILHHDRPLDAFVGAQPVADKAVHVLLTLEGDQSLPEAKESIIQSLGEPPGVEETELDIPSLPDDARPADLD